MSQISVVIVAGGTGSRMKSAIKKQYLSLNGKEVIAHTVEVFNVHPEISEIIVVTGDKDVDYTTQLLINKYHYQKVKKIVAGGKERQDSVYNGMMLLEKNTDYVMIHDGARPLVSAETITQAIARTKQNKATVVAVPVKDTIKVVNSDHKIIQTPPREQLWIVQTPQSFEVELIRQAHEKAKREGYYGTDDAMLVEYLGKDVSIVEGDYTNIKITTPEDLIVAEGFLNKKI